MFDTVFPVGKTVREESRKEGVKNPRRRAEYRVASHTKWKRTIYENTGKLDFHPSSSVGPPVGPVRLAPFEPAFGSAG
jgi:hypothetical protein